MGHQSNCIRELSVKQVTSRQNRKSDIFRCLLFAGHFDYAQCDNREVENVSKVFAHKKIIPRLVIPACGRQAEGVEGSGDNVTKNYLFDNNLKLCHRRLFFQHSIVEVVIHVYIIVSRMFKNRLISFLEIFLNFRV